MSENPPQQPTPQENKAHVAGYSNPQSEQFKQTATNAVRPKSADEIDYIIHGNDMQFVEIILDPQEAVVAEAGAMMFMEDGVQMNTRMTDGSEKHSGIMGTLMGSAKRYMAGERLFMTFFTNNSRERKHVSFAAPYPGSIIPLDLGQLGTILCQKDGFLCGAKGVTVGVGFTKRIGAGMFGGEGYILQKLYGDGMAFIHAGGSILVRDLMPNEVIYVDTGSLVAFQSTVDFNIKMVTGVSNMMFGGEDLFLTTLKGPGRVWMQSMPFPRLVVNIREAINATRSSSEKKRDKKLQKMADKSK